MKTQRFSSRLLAGVLAIILIAGVSGCRPDHSDSAAAPASPATNRHFYQVKGVIVEILPEKKKVKITHEEIPGYMDAMTMMFDVREAGQLNGFQKGDPVSFRMIVTDDDGWIDQLKKVDGPRTLPTEPANFRQVREVEPLAAGDVMPDYGFTNALGRSVRLSTFKGQALVFTFIFTRCPFPTFCPRLSGNFAEAQNKLLAMPAGPTNWHFLSITIDPAYDTPARLAAYAERYHADAQRWDFVTGDLVDITALGEQFGLQFWRPDPAQPINHNVRTVVVDAAGRVQWVSVENEWKAATLVEQVVKAAGALPGK